MLAPSVGASGAHDDGLTTLQQIIVAVSSISLFLATVFMLLRLYTSAFITRRFELDDRECAHWLRKTSSKPADHSSPSWST